MATFTSTLNHRSGRYQASLLLVMFLLSSLVVLAVLLVVYYRKSDSTIPDEYIFRLDSAIDEPLLFDEDMNANDELSPE